MNGTARILAVALALVAVACLFAPIAGACPPVAVSGFAVASAPVCSQAVAAPQAFSTLSVQAYSQPVAVQQVQAYAMPVQAFSVAPFAVASYGVSAFAAAPVVNVQAVSVHPRVRVFGGRSVTVSKAKTVTRSR